MQYKSCMKCVHHGKRCQMVMAQSMNVLNNLEYLIKYSQPRSTDIDSKCKIKIEYSCENFMLREENKNVQ